MLRKAAVFPVDVLWYDLSFLFLISILKQKLHKYSEPSRVINVI